MGVDHRLIRNSENFKGLDLRSSDIKRTMEYSSDMRNAAYRATGAINKRKGFKIATENPDNAYGVATFRKVNKDTGNIEDEFISINGNANKLIDKNLTLEYEGESDIWYSLYLEENSSSFTFELKEQDTVLLTIPLGSGFSDSDKTIAGLAYDINNSKLPIATAIPGSFGYLLNLGSTSGAPGGAPTQESQDYTLNLLPSNITNSTAMYVGQYIKLGDDNTWLEIQGIEEHKDGAGRTILYTLSLYGATTYIDSNGEVSERVGVYQYYDVTASYDPSISQYKAALLDSGENVAIESVQVGGTQLATRVWEQIPNGDPSVENAFEWITPQGTNARLDQEFENATFSSLHNALYISNGYDHVHKYDGKYLYRAGLPSLPADDSLFTIADVPTGVSSRDSAPGLRQYKFVLEYTDALGNIISSQPSDIRSYTAAAGNYVGINWSVSGIEAILKGRDLQGTFDSDHSSYDALSSLPTTTGGTPYRPENVDYANSNEVTFDDFNKYKDEKRLRVKIYRTKVYTQGQPPSQFFLIGDVPYDQPNINRIVDGTLGTGPGLIDSLLDNELNVFNTLVDPLKRHDPPPKGKYISTYKNCLVIAGQLNNVNNLQYSLPKNAATGEIGCEYFPDDSNGVIVNSKFGDKITAIAPLRDLLYIFHNDSVHILGGQINLLEDPMVDLLTKEGGVGCVSHNSIEEFRNQLLFLSESGIYTIDASNSLQELSSPINPLFNDPDLKMKRAVSFNWTDENLLVTMIPKEDFAYIPETVTEIVQHPDSITYFDLQDRSWIDGVYTVTGTSRWQTIPEGPANIASTSINGLRGSGLKLEITITNNTDVSIKILDPGTGYVPGDVIRIDPAELGGSGYYMILRIEATDKLLNVIYTSPFEDSLIVAYDYFNNAWLRWDSLDFTGGVSLYRDRIMFATRGQNVSYLCSMSNTGTKYDYADHSDPIEFYYETNWESLAEPTIPKKFLRMKLYSMDTDQSFESSTFSLLASFYENYLPANLGSIQFNFGQDVLGWGEFPWGKSAWGNPSINIQKHKLASRKAKSLKVRFSNTDVNTNILLTNYEYEIATPYQTEIKD